MHASSTRRWWAGLFAVAISLTANSDSDANPSATGCDDDSASPVVESHYDTWCEVEVEEIRDFPTPQAAQIYASLAKSNSAFVLREGNLVYIGASSTMSMLKSRAHTFERAHLLEFKETSEVSEASDDPPLLWLDAADVTTESDGEFIDPRDLLYSHDAGFSPGYSFTMSWIDDFANSQLRRMIGLRESGPSIPARRGPPRVAVLDTGVFAHDEFRRPPFIGLPRLHWYDAALTEQGEQCDSITQRVGLAHGTQVAGLIAANAQDARGIAGIGEVDELLSIDVPELVDGCFSRKRLVAALNCAVKQGANIVNISMQSSAGRPRPDDLYDAMRQNAVTNAVATKGAARALVVVAAGNRGCDLCKKNCSVWPGAVDLPWVITVEALEWSGRRQIDSNWGRSVDLAVPAPAIDSVCSTTVGSVDPGANTCSGGYSEFAYTSAAAAVVTGAATRVWSHPNYDQCTAEGIRNVLRGNGRPLINVGSVSCLLQMDFLYKETFLQDGSFANLCSGLEEDVPCGSLRGSPP